MLAHWRRHALAHLLEVSPLTRRTARALTDAGSLFNNLEGTRARGYVIHSEEHATGLRCIAVPLFDHAMTARASLWIPTPAERLRDVGRRRGTSAGQFSRGLVVVKLFCCTGSPIGSRVEKGRE
jgi:DNA-binding IclR family transcriptional regulator